MQSSERVRLMALGLLVGTLVLLMGAAWPLHAQEGVPQEPGWSEPVSLSEGFPTSYLPDIAADRAGNLYVVWDALFEEREEGRWSDGLGFTMWDGQSWLPAVDIFGLEISHLPAIAVDSNGRVHLIGVGDIGLGYSRAWGQLRPADARAWSDPIDLSGGYIPYWNDIVVDSHDRIHVVFSGSDVIEGQECMMEACDWVFYTRSIDGGDSWSEPARISSSMGGGRVQIVIDASDNLYVAWSNEPIEHDGTFVSGPTGFVYSLDGGTSWSEPEAPVFTPRTWYQPTLGEWVSIAVDRQQTIHLIAVSPEEIRHAYREGLNNPWTEENIPNREGFNPGYGYRWIVVDSDDRLHLVLPTTQGISSPSGLVHATWNRMSGWSGWLRAISTHGRGCGLGNLVFSEGNRLNVVWFEYEDTAFVGKNRIYYTYLRTDSQPITRVPLPPLPSPTVPVSSVGPAATLRVIPSATPLATVIPLANIDSPPFQSAPINSLLVGVGAAVLILGIVVGVVTFHKIK